MNRACNIYFFKITQVTRQKPEDFFDQKELQAYEKIRNPKRKSEFLASRFFVKSVLRNFYGIKNPTVQIQKNGKPFVKGIFFNISHSGNIILLAVHSKSEVGIDFQERIGQKSFLKVARRLFHEIETNYILKGRTEKQQISRFKLLWSLKEAYIKSSGMVLNRKSLQIYFDLENKKILEAPARKQFQIFYSEKLNLALTVQGKPSVIDKPAVYDVRLVGDQITRNKKIGVRFSNLSWQGKA